MNNIHDQYDKLGLTNIIDNRKFDNEMCTGCSLRPGCYLCKDFAQKINKDNNVCPLRYNNLGEINIDKSN